MARLATALLCAALLAPAVLAPPALGVAGGGGGGSSGGSGGSSDRPFKPIRRPSGEGGATPWYVLTAGGLAFLGMQVVLFRKPLGRALRRARWGARVRNKARDTEAALRAADSDPDALRERVREAFFPLQAAWERGDLDHARAYLGDGLSENWKHRLLKLEAAGERNHIEDLALDDIQIIETSSGRRDRFTAAVSFRARDWNERAGEVTQGKRDRVRRFRQYWTFERADGGDWLVRAVRDFDAGGEDPLSEPAQPRARQRAPRPRAARARGSR